MGFEIPPWLEWYKKPAYVDIKRFAASFNEKSSGSRPGSRPSSPISTGSIPKKWRIETPEFIPGIPWRS